MSVHSHQKVVYNLQFLPESRGLKSSINTNFSKLLSLLLEPGLSDTL